MSLPQRFTIGLLALSFALPVFAAGTSFPGITDTDHLRGDKNAQITLIVYADFQCPFCQKHEKTLRQLRIKYGSAINQIYRPFPLSFHEHAMSFAIAAECVGTLKGEAAFWRFHEFAYKKLSRKNLPKEGTERTLALNLKAGSARFDACVKNPDTAAHIAAAIERGSNNGVQGTPATFIVDNTNGDVELVSGAFPVTSFTKIIDAMLKGSYMPKKNSDTLTR